MATYSEKLRDPRWQRKRLEVLNRDDFTCQCCGADDKTLHVHHGYYKRNAMPWEYPAGSLWVLCAECHAEAEAARDDLHRAVGYLHPSTYYAAYLLLCAFVAIQTEQRSDGCMTEAISSVIESLMKCENKAETNDRFLGRR
jgi:hypothetical protein